MSHKHVDPEQAAKAHLDLEAKLSIGMHFETFRMSNEAFDAPRKEIEIAKKKLGIPERDFIAPQFGQSFYL